MDRARGFVAHYQGLSGLDRGGADAAVEPVVDLVLGRKCELFMRLERKNYKSRVFPVSLYIYFFRKGMEGNSKTKAVHAGGATNIASTDADIVDANNHVVRVFDLGNGPIFIFGVAGSIEED